MVKQMNSMSGKDKGIYYYMQGVTCNWCKGFVIIHQKYSASKLTISQELIFFNSSHVFVRHSFVHNWLPSIWVRQSLLVLYKYMGCSLYGLKIKIHLRRKQRLHKIKKWLGHLGLEVISIARWLSCSLSYSYIIPFLWCPTIQCKGRIVSQFFNNTNLIVYNFSFRFD